MEEELNYLNERIYCLEQNNDTFPLSPRELKELVILRNILNYITIKEIN